MSDPMPSSTATPPSLASYPLLPVAGLSFLGGLIMHELFEMNIYTKWASWGLGVTLPALCTTLFGANLSADEHNAKLKVLNELAQKKLGKKNNFDPPANTSTVSPVEGIVGFVNPGNGCYANTALQMLSCMRKEIEAVKTSNPLQERLRRALLNAFEERDFQASKGVGKAKPVSFYHVQVALDALTVFRAKEAGLPVAHYQEPFNFRVQQCAAEVVELVVAELGIVKWQINPFLRYKELRDDNGRPRYNFIEYGKYFLENEEDSQEVKPLRAVLKTMHTEHTQQGVSSKTIGEFLQITTRLAEQDRENELFSTFMKSTEPKLPDSIPKWNISEHLLYAFWKCKLWDNPTLGDASDPLPNAENKNETPYQFLKHYTLGTYRESSLLKTFKNNSSQKNIVKKLLEFAAFQKEVGLTHAGEDGRKVVSTKSVEFEGLQEEQQKKLQQLWKEFEELTNQIAETLKRQDQKVINKFLNNDDVQMDQDPKRWLVGQRMAFAYWHINKFHPRLSQVRNPVAEEKGAASTIRVSPIHRNTSDVNSIQEMIDQKSTLKQDWEVSAHLGLNPPKFLPIYFSRFALSEPVVEEKKEEASGFFSIFFSSNKSESEKTESKPVPRRDNMRVAYKVKPEAEISIQVGEKKHVYILNAIGAHSSNSSASGHYYGYIKTGNQWVQANDSSATPKSWEKVQEDVSTKGYVFLYRQKDN
ncbi:MAG: ubiquitin carboxyl-terminal hydrolase [Verrucomicrobia bacterium]|nr:ubiquitin carboxyl-terminal hydrolase [Verrucomicrobiota bacterium]